MRKRSTRVRRIVAERAAQQPVVVVSALARVTDALLQAASLAAAGDEPGLLALLDPLQERHSAAVLELLRASGRRVASD